MRLSPGTKLGHYEIHSLIGAGGMGEVYLGKDQVLRRKVAIFWYPLSTSFWMKRSDRRSPDEVFAMFGSSETP